MGHQPESLSWLTAIQAGHLFGKRIRYGSGLALATSHSAYVRGIKTELLRHSAENPVKKPMPPNQLWERGLMSQGRVLGDDTGSTTISGWFPWQWNCLRRAVGRGSRSIENVAGSALSAIRPDRRVSIGSYGVISKATPRLYLPPLEVVPKILPLTSTITPQGKLPSLPVNL